MRFIPKAAVVGAVLIGVVAVQLRAGLLVEERFDYPQGASIGAKSGGSGFAGNWIFGLNSAAGGTGALTALKGGVVVSGTHSTWATRTLSVTADQAPVVYFSYDVSCVGLEPLASNSFFDAVVFKTGKPGGYSTLFQAGLHYGATSGLRVRVTAGGAESTLVGASQAAPNIVYTVVGKFTFDDGAGNAALAMWVNPKGESAAPVFTRSWASTATGITQVVLQRFDDKARAAGCTTLFDNLLIGTDWASVAGAKAE